MSVAHACAGVLFGVTTVISHACTAHTLTRTQPHMRDIGKVERGITSREHLDALLGQVFHVRRPLGLGVMVE